MSWITDADKQKQALQEKHPNWRIWYVPHFAGSKPFFTWHGYRLPHLNANSAEEFEEYVREAEADELKAAK
jgi:hypothetical protein